MVRSVVSSAVALLLGVSAVAAAPAAQAATTVIEDQTSCEAAGGTWFGGPLPCNVFLSIPVGDTVELRVDTTLILGGPVAGTLIAETDEVRLPTGMSVGSTGQVFASTTGTFRPDDLNNAGDVHVQAGSLRFGAINRPNSHSNSGRIFISNGAEMYIRALATLNNTGEIIKGCSGTITLESFNGSTAQITGNAPVEDCTGPEAAPVVTPTPNAAGWVNELPTVEWNWSDNLAGIDKTQCAPSTALGDVGEYDAKGDCTDRVGNQAFVTFPLKIDTTAPTAAPTVTGSLVTWNWSDEGSGLNGCDEQTLAVGSGTVTVSSTCTDVAGNTHTATQDVTIADPVVTPESVQAGEKVTFEVAGFAAGEKVTVTLFSDPVQLGQFTAGDTGVLSGEVTIPADTPPGPHTLRFDGTQSEVTTSVDLTVTAAPTPTPTPEPTPSPTTSPAAAAANLSDTGADNLGATLRLGGLLVLAGGLLLLAGQRRSTGTGLSALMWLHSR